MKIAVNGIFYQPKGGGIKEYIDNLIKNLALIPCEHDFVVYVLQDQFEYARKHLPSKFRLKVVPFNSGSLLNRIKRSVFEKRFWTKEEMEEKFDIFHSPFFHSPRFKKAKILLTVHDLRLYRFPETYEFFRYHFLKNKVKKSIRRADHIISISEFTKQEIINLCGVDKDKISVIHEAINREKFSNSNIDESEIKYDVLKNNRFIFTVGHMEPRKNYDRLIEAFNKIKSKEGLKDLQLVIVGKKDHSFENTLQLIDSTPDVHYLNFVSDNLLNWLYKNADLFVFPSYYEGFGFPPLEAAALGTVSAVSNVSSIPEICGDAAFYFNPFDVDDIASVIEKALTSSDLRKEMLLKVEERLKDFSWKRNALQTVEIYNKIAKDEI